MSMWLAIPAATCAAAAFLAVGTIKQPTKFYEIAAGIMPAFLIAVAVERSLLGTLGTKADFTRARREETADGYSARGFDDGVKNTIDFAFLERLGDILGDTAMLSIPVEPVDILKAAAIGHWDDDPLFWSIFRDQLQLEFGLPDDPDYFDPPAWVDPSDAFAAMKTALRRHDPGDSIRLLAAHAVLREDRAFKGGSVGINVVTSELRRLHDSDREAEMKSVLSRITYRAGLRYDRQVNELVLSLSTSIVLITVTEFLALIGVLSPGRPYSGLFVVTAAAVVASITNVAGGAVADLARSRRRG